jgi:hypothetical protein
MGGGFKQSPIFYDIVQVHINNSERDSDYTHYLTNKKAISFFILCISKLKSIS